MKTFTLISFAWMENVENRLAAAGEQADSRETILIKLSALASFLDCNGLSTRRLSGKDGNVSEDFVLRSVDLTDKGLVLMKKSLEKWQREAKTANDVEPLRKMLDKISKDKLPDKLSGK